jgi:MerR family copper efflux transcriptional regulator
MSKPMVIGAVARKTGVPAKTIRYYEETGLIPPAERAPNGYRVYGERAIHLLQFVKRARDLGFSVADVGNLLALWADETRESAEVKKLALRHLHTIEQKIEQLATLRSTLQQLIDHCHGDERPDCPILADLAGHEHEREERT